MPNYFAPAFQVQVNNRELEADVSVNIEQVSVVSKPDTMDTFNMTLANPYPTMRWTHTKDADLFMEGNSVKIAMGYGSTGELQVLMEGEITGLSLTFPDSGVPTVTVNGHTLLHRLHGDKKATAFQKMTDKEIVQKIASDAGLEPQCDETGEQFEYLMQANQTDWEFVKQRAARIHYEVLIKGKTLIFRRIQQTEAKVFKFVWGYAQAELGGPDTLPLKSFAPDMSALSQMQQVIVRGWNPATKQEIIGRAGKGSEDANMGSTTSAQVSEKLHKSRTHVQVNLPVATQAEADQRASAIYNQNAMKLVSGTAATIGVPDLKSGSRVTLSGLGPRFSGDYFVNEATHTIGNAGYSTSFTVKRNAVSK
ncbi:MAG: phage late control D family protein [Acidobacteriaceae bacterium]|nr:phage late control D family protein [Acidobacteriaceae bacterium]MBV9778554.1 phage late control D family protein [Acidobacteriaceae bacterium]